MIFYLHERWTTYDERDGIKGSESRVISKHETFAEARAARKILDDELYEGGHTSEVDSFISDEDGRHIYYYGDSLPPPPTTIFPEGGIPF